MTGRPRLAFISPVFLFPNDTGGKIRTSNILKGLKGGAFDVTLAMPAARHEPARWAQSVSALCDRLVQWQPPPVRARWRRGLDLLDKLPVNVVADRSPEAISAVRTLLSREAFDVVVFDFIHSAVLRPANPPGATVCFTHNVEAEIFERHAVQACSPLMRRVWASQHAKMRRYELDELRRFTTVVAVSRRDAEFFREHYGIPAPAVISTGVDLDYFAWREPPPVDSEHPPTVVFTGSMDWAANVDGVEFFLSRVWPLVLSQVPDARFVVVGRQPPAALVEQARGLRGVSLTGFVDDVRPHVHAAHVFVIPLRVGGGTRIKAFEAMAMGCPVVSTSIGIEGLDLAPGEHYQLGDSPAQLAQGIVALLEDAELRAGLSRRARRCVEERYSHRVAAREFEAACLRSLHRVRVERAPASLLHA